jgi:hypothetical protein
MNALLFPLLAAPALAQGVIPQPLGVGGDKLYSSTADYRAQHPDCFLPPESLPPNYKVSEYRDYHGDDNFDCQVTSIGNDQLRLPGFRVQKKSTVIVNGHVAAIFYDLDCRDLLRNGPYIARALGRTYRRQD